MSPHRSRRPGRGTTGGGGQRGAVTAELAVALVPVAVLLLMAAWLAAAGTEQVRVQLAAGAAARALARGEDPGLVSGRVAEAVDGAVLSVQHDGGLVRVEVVAPVSAPLLGPVASLRSSAAAPLEDGGEDVP